MVGLINFNKQLSVILENKTAGRMHPAIVITARDVEIKADHARWMKTTKGNVFLAVGIQPRIVQRAVGYYNRGGVLRQARDFYAPEMKEHAPIFKQIVRQRFSKILTIKKENVKSLNWL
jgi:hypothetical protein